MKRVGDFSNYVDKATTITGSTTQTTILDAVPNKRLILRKLIVTSSSATAEVVTFKDATSGTTRLILAIAATGGAVAVDVDILQTSANNNWTATCTTGVSSVYIYAQGEEYPA